MLVRFGDEVQPSTLTLLCNTGAGEVFSNVRENLKRGYAKFKEEKANNRPVVLCASGPSLADSLESIRAMQKRGAFILAMNGTGKFLHKNGIKPNAIALVDPRIDNKDFVEEAWAPEAWMASQCHPEVIEQAEKVGMKIVLWHPGTPDIQNHIPANDSLRMGGGFTIGLCAISCAFVAGFREMHLFGYDSSHRDNKGHSFRQDRNAADELMTAVVDSQVFTASTVMAAQASMFLEFSTHVLKDGAEIHVHGEGLLPTLWRLKMKEKALKVLSAAYDLGVSPPTYDFISFLAEAERYRIARGYDAIDLSFQPGPMHGFRHDDLPPDYPTRKAMLLRVPVGIARLLPSVRNIHILSVRQAVGKDVFPPEWSDENPIAHYGAQYQKGASLMFKASEHAKKWSGKFAKPYATITVRQSSYHSQRNSNLTEWFKIAEWLLRQNIEPIFIPDTENSNLGGWNSCPEAALDVDLRAALYEGALINLGVANGPMYLCPFLESRYLIFNINVESSHSSSTEFLLSHGIAKGDETAFGGNGRVIWKPDTAENIIAELGEFEIKRLEKTS